MSRIPLQFLVYVYTANTRCQEQPQLVGSSPQDNECIAIADGQTYRASIEAEALTSGAVIAEILTVSPPGLTKSQLQTDPNNAQRSHVNFTWTPDQSQRGQHIFCFHAEDTNGLTSEQRCVTLLVGDTSPDAVLQTLTPVGVIDVTNRTEWTINFDTEIQRPSSSRYIRFYNSSHYQVHIINTRTSSDVSINNRTLTFWTPPYTFDSGDYHILIDQGAVVGLHGCAREGPAFSGIYDRSLWTFSGLEGTVQRYLDNKGTEFIVGFLQNYRGSELLLYIISASAEPASVTISAPGANYSEQLVVTDAAAQVITLPTNITLSGHERAMKGVSVTADRKIILYCVNKASSTTDGFLALPVDILGREYVVASYTPRYSNHPSEFAIIGVEYGTSVSITVKGTMYYQGWLYTDGSTLTLTLDRLEAIQFQGSNQSDLTGTHIVSDKPVSVMSGVQCANVPTQVSACDHLVEHLPSVNTWGKRFVTVPLSTRSGGDIFRIVAARNNTVIDGVPPRTLDAGDFWELDIPSNTYRVITSSQPIMVLQYCKGQSSDNTPADPFMMYVLAVEQFAADYSFATVSGVADNSYVNIVIKTSETSGLTYNGNLLPSSTTWTPISNTDLSATQLHIMNTTGIHEIKHTSATVPFSAVYYGFSSYHSVGFPLGLRISGAQCKATDPLDGDGVDNDCDGLVDEEILNARDDDGDGLIDEDFDDVDECELAWDNCDPDAVCANTHGSYMCNCKPGFTGDGNTCQVDGATCEAWGDPHYTTFDGQVHHFQGSCDYVLAEHCGNTTDFRVEVTNEPCGSSSRVSCTRAVYLDVKGHRVSILQGKKVLVNGVRFTPPFNLNGTIWGSYSGMFVLLKTDTSVKVFYDGSHYAKVFVPGSYRNQMCGLCGDFDGIQGNDYMTSYGWVSGDLNTFGESWATSWSSCTGVGTDDGLSTSAPPGVCDPVLQQTVSGPTMCGIITEPNGTFSVCEDYVDLSVFYDTCVFDVCANSGDTVQLCQNLESAAHACVAKMAEELPAAGLSWRRHDLCPLSCGPNSTYSACTSACPNTCSSPNTEANCVDICVEGCECNPGLVLSGDSCIHPNECGCQRNGRYFEVDDVWGERGNLQCTCRRGGSISCTSITCEDEFTWTVDNYDYGCSCLHQHQCTDPEKPSDLTLVSTSETTIEVSWSPSPFTDRYHVMATALGNRHWTTPSTNYAVISGLDPGTMYNISVYSNRGSRQSNGAANGQFATDVDAPTGLQVDHVTYNTISISWTLPRSTLVRFRVSDAPVSGSSRDLYPPPGPQDTSAVVTGLVSGVQYRITLVAIGLYGESAETTITATTESGRGSLTCDTSLMRVVFMREVLVGVDVDTMRLRDSSCRADVNNTHVVLTAPLNGCGTTAQDGTDTSKISFTNEVVSGAPVTDGVIIRNLELRWTFRCDYVRQDVVGVGPILFPVPLPDVPIPFGNGSFTFSMNLYHSEAYLRPFEQSEFPVKVTVNHMLHFGLAVASDVSGFVLFVENCKATPTSNHNDAKQYFIIRDGCEEDDTLEEFETSDPISRRYAIRAFRFINETMVYLHCDVMVCLADDPDSRCSRGCEAQPARRRREVSAEMQPRAAVVQGPIVLVPEETTPAPPECPTDCHEHAFCSAVTKTCVCKEGWVGNGVHCEEKDLDWCSIITCDVTDNRRCRNTAGSYVCECKPGFMEFNGRCEVSRAYQFSIRLQARQFTDDLENKQSAAFIALVTEVTQTIEELFHQTDMSGVFLGIVILGFRSGSVVVDIRLNIRESADEEHGQAQLTAAFRDAVSSQNGTHLDIDRDSVEMTDFNECSSTENHDCPTEAFCVNTAGSFTCQCREGYKDQSAAQGENPGRICVSTGDEFPVMWVAVGGGTLAACIVVVMAACLCVRKRRKQGCKSKRRDDMEAYDNVAYINAAGVQGNSTPAVGAPIPLSSMA